MSVALIGTSHYVFPQLTSLDWSVGDKEDERDLLMRANVDERCFFRRPSLFLNRVLLYSV